MSKKYEVWTQSEYVCDLMGLVKTYPFRIQAVMWCFLNGYVKNCGRFGLCLDDRVKIVEVEDE